MAKAAVSRRARDQERRRYVRTLLAEARRTGGLTQMALAARLGRPQSFVSKVEKGERRLDLVEFVDVARAIGIDPARVLADLQRH